MKPPKKPRIIGGMFGLPEPSRYARRSPFMANRKAVFLANGRSGIAILAERLSPPQIWLPSYLCGVILRALKGTKSKIMFYEIGADLEMASDDWLDRTTQGDLVIFIDYFGFPFESNYAGIAREKGAWVLEDACQAFPSPGIGRASDFLLFSPRKFLGISDGGVLVPRGRAAAILRGIDLGSPDLTWWASSLAALVLRREFDLHGGNRLWFDLFQKTENESPIGPYAMSEYTRIALNKSFDYEEIAGRRIRNYRILLESLESWAIFPKLPPDIVPMGFPIRVKERDELRKRLFEKNIYPPVHWPITGLVPGHFRDSHRLSAEILSLPCDQRYGKNDMTRMADLVWKALKGNRKPS